MASTSRAGKGATMKKLRRLFVRNREERGDAVLVTSVITVPLLCLCFAFASSISMGTWQHTSYRSAAQQAATASLQSVNGIGVLDQKSVETFVREYRAQTGRVTGPAGSGTGKHETDILQSKNCESAVINGTERKLPYIEVQLDESRAAGLSSRVGRTY